MEKNKDFKSFFDNYESTWEHIMYFINVATFFILAQLFSIFQLMLRKLHSIT